MSPHRMHSVSFQSAPLPRILAPLLAGLLLAGLVLTSPKAAESHSFIINPTDGYGIGECLAAGTACGRVVADAWCEAHGHSASLAFGRADDLTAAIDGDIEVVARRDFEPGSFIISCGQ